MAKMEHSGIHLPGDYEIKLHREPRTPEDYRSLGEMIFMAAALPADESPLEVDRIKLGKKVKPTVFWVRHEPRRVARTIVDQKDGTFDLNVITDRPDRLHPRPPGYRRVPVDEMPHAVSQYIFGDGGRVHGMRQLLHSFEVPPGLRGDRLQEYLATGYPQDPNEATGIVSEFQARRFDDEIATILRDSLDTAV
jgi:hypothetical protein